MEINSLKLKGKDANIFVADTNAGQFVLHSDAIVRFGIVAGEVDEKIFNECVEESEQIIATNTALKYINNRIKTEKQIKDYLYKKGCKTPLIKYVLDKLKGYGLINDAIYAESYARSNPNFSKRKLQMKLSSMGVKKDEVADALNDVDESESCLKNAQKFLKSHAPTRENLEKLTRRLIGQGYGWDTIHSTLNQLKLEIEEME